MTVVDPRLAAEIIAPREDPRFYDDIGCLANDLKKRGAPAGGRTYVSDHATGALIDANTAMYTRAENLDTPMGSHLIAHANSASREADAAARGGQVLSAIDVFGAAGTPGGDDHEH